VVPHALREGQAVEVVRLLHRLNDSAIRTAAVALHRQATHLMAEGLRQRPEPLRRERVALVAVGKSRQRRLRKSRRGMAVRWTARRRRRERW
jgi:hypothetical protein